MITYFTNLGIGIVLNLMFRTSYSAKRMRSNFEFFSGVSRKRLQRRHPEARFEPLNIDGIPAEIIKATPNPEAVILYLHGGGYFSGSISTHRHFLMKLARICDSRILAIDYRLAPEHPFPAGLEDAKKAFAYLSKKYPSVPKFIGGDSAGGGLTLATLLALRDDHVPLPSGAFCICPWADLLGTGKSVTTNHKKDVWLSQKHINTWAPWYHGDQDPKLPHLSPVNGNYKGLPPLLLFAGDQEVLLDDAIRVHENALKENVHSRLILGKKMQHGWFLGAPWLSESKRAISELKGFISNPGSLRP